jgi:hypothetical protein
MIDSRTLWDWMVKMGAPPPNDPFTVYLGIEPIWLLGAINVGIGGMILWFWLDKRAERKRR